MRQIDYSELRPETRAVLEAIRDDLEPMPARNLPLPGFRKLMTELARPYLNRAGLLMVPYTLHLRFCAAIAGPVYKYSGCVLFHDLVAQVLCWIGYGLEETTVAGVLSACYAALKQWKEPSQQRTGGHIQSSPAAP